MWIIVILFLSVVVHGAIQIPCSWNHGPSNNGVVDNEFNFSCAPLSHTSDLTVNTTLAQGNLNKDIRYIDVSATVYNQPNDREKN
eukprot:UN03011